MKPKFTRLKILNNEEKKEIEEQLGRQFGVKKTPGILVMRGSERLFLFTGNLSEERIKELEDITIVERLGVYFAKIEEKIEGIRLSIEGSQLLKDQISKNIYEISEEDTDQWMKGHELNIKAGKKGFLIIKHREDFLGTGKASEEKIRNFIPKNRRLKEKS